MKDADAAPVLPPLAAIPELDILVRSPTPDIDDARIETKGSMRPTFEEIELEVQRAELAGQTDRLSLEIEEQLPRYMTLEERRTSLEIPTSPAPSETSSIISEDRIFSVALEFADAPPPYADTIPRLAKPVAVPQVTNGPCMPYARAYATALQCHGISAEEFMKFIDGLNIVTTDSPPLQALAITGEIMLSVPVNFVDLAGGVLWAGAEIGKVIVARIRADRFIKAANERFFHPRKLHAIICNTDAMREAVCIPEDTELAAALDDSTIAMNVMQRRLAAVQPYLSLMTTDVPARSQQSTVLQKLCDMQVRRSQRMAERDARRGRAKSFNGQLPADLKEQLAAAHSDWSEKQLDKREKRMRKQHEKGRKKKDKYEEKIREELEKLKNEAEEAIAKAKEKGKEKVVQRQETKLQEGIEKLERKGTKREKKWNKKDREVKKANLAKWIVILPWEEGRDDELTPVTSRTDSLTKELFRWDSLGRVLTKGCS